MGITSLAETLLKTVRGTERADIKAKITMWDLFYEADYASLREIFEDYFKPRWVRSGKEFPFEWFVYQNQIAPIVEKRADAISTEDLKLDAEEGAEAALEWVRAWIKGPYFGDGFNLTQALGAWTLWMERHGNLVLKLSLNKGNVFVSRMPVETADVFVAPEDITSVQGWEFAWKAEGKLADGTTISRHIREVMTSDKFFRYEDEELVREDVLPWGMIPVVHIRENASGGGIWGISIIDKLIEPQLQLAAVMSNIRAVNRLSGWPIFKGEAPHPAVNLTPGAYNPDPTLAAVSWPVSTDSLSSEKEDILQALCDVGKVTMKRPEVVSATGNMPSGKAMMVLSQDGVVAMERIKAILEEGLAELFEKAAAMAGKLKYEPDKRKLRVQLPPLRLEDVEVTLKKAKLILDMKALGILPMELSLKAILALNVLPIDATPDDIIRELEAEAPVYTPAPPQTEEEAG